MGELKIHPTAARFPALPDDQLTALAQDIKANGQRAPIMLTADGETIVDGVNRLNACTRAGTKPKFKRLPRSYSEADIVAFIIGSNLRRRDLNPGQKAMLALDVAADYQAAAKERIREGGRKGREAQARQRANGKPRKARSSRAKKPLQVRDELGALAGVAGTTISHAKIVKAFSADLSEKVINGELSLHEAYLIARRTKVPTPDDGPPGQGVAVIVTHEGVAYSNYPLPKAKPKFNFTNDQVSWAAHTWNPVTGCLHNCPYCYAREGIEVNVNLKKHYPFGFTPSFFEYRLSAPTNTKLPDNWRDDPRLGRVFVSSMGDLFGKWVPDEWIAKVFDACNRAPWWEYLFLTKFPQRYVGLQLPATAWIGTTVDTQDRVKIAETAFGKINGVRLKWLSCEPMLEPLQFNDISVFDFIVIGSQSATKQPGGMLVKEIAPKMRWVINLINQATQAGVLVYCKPNLMGIPNDQCAGMELIQEVPNLPDLPARTIQGNLFEAAE